MLKVYLDWNVMSGMKGGFQSELLNIVKDKSKFILLYSTSHIGDISASYSLETTQQEIIKSDLDFISELTENLCLFNDGKNIQIGYQEPSELLENSIESKKITENFSLDNIFKSFTEENDKVSELGNTLKNLIANIPLDAVFKDAFNNPESAEMLNKIFPNLKDDLTMSGFFKCFGLMLENLNEKEGYKDLKELVQKVGVNSGIYNNKNPFEVIENAYKKMGVEKPFENVFLESSENAPKWYNEITNEYLKLDIHSFNSDKVKVTDKKKQTFKNTTEDSFHSAYASTCDFYITNDKKNYAKTKAVFKKLNLNTYVLNTDEFIDFYHLFLEKIDFKNSWEKFTEVVKSGDFIDISENNNPNEFSKVHFSNFYYFGYFNRIFMFNSDDNNSISFQFGRILPTNCLMVYYKEIKELVKIIVDYLGKDNDGNTYFIEEEIDENRNWKGRNWTFENFGYRLVKQGWYIQLYYDIDI